MVNKKKVNKEETFNAWDVFGITEKRSDELIKQIGHFNIEAETMDQLAEMLEIQNAGDLGYKVYLWARAIEINNRQGNSEILKMVMGRRSQE